MNGRGGEGRGGERWGGEGRGGDRKGRVEWEIGRGRKGRVVPVQERFAC